MNLALMDEDGDLDWVKQLLKILSQLEFNSGKYKGAIFHLNFEASETLRLSKKRSKKLQSIESNKLLKS